MNWRVLCGRIRQYLDKTMAIQVLKAAQGLFTLTFHAEGSNTAVRMGSGIRQATGWRGVERNLIKDEWSKGHRQLRITDWKLVIRPNDVVRELC